MIPIFDFSACWPLPSYAMDDHKFIILGHCPHDEVRLTAARAGALQVSQEQLPSAIAEPLTVAFHFFFPRTAASSFARKPATEPEEDIMGRRKQHCPKKATDGESDQELQSASISSGIKLLHLLDYLKSTILLNRKAAAAASQCGHSYG